MRKRRDNIVYAKPIRDAAEKIDRYWIFVSIPLIISVITFIFLLIFTFKKDLFIKNRSLGYFKENVTAALSYKDMIDVFGKPDSEIGSGLYIYVYILNDGSKVLFGYQSKSNVFYIYHENNSGERENLLELD
ncbi:MAG: hypothetical protein GF390_02405 [Candidatus Pacebacteria bacterium]|nr:hypothetical protein [Candidatus Paceibacterota bacterium]